MTEIADERGGRRAAGRSRPLPFSRTVFEVERRDAGRVFSAVSEVTRLRAERGGAGVRFSVPAADRSKVVAICTSLCYNYKIIKEKGPLLFAAQAAGRAGIVLGTVAAAVLAAVYPMFVIRVEYTGDLIDGVAETVERSGVCEWTFLPGLDCEALERELLALDGVAFAAVTRRGTRVYVDVRAERHEDGILGIPAGNVTAKVSASVTRVIVRQGTAEVSYGDIVREGDVLIGAYVISGEEKVPCAADGEVYGLVSRTYTRFFPDTVLEKRFGRVERVSRISFGGRVPETPESPFENCIVETEAVRNGFLLGYTLYTFTFREVLVRESENTLSAEEMEKEASLDAVGGLPPGAEILSVTARTRKTDGGTVVTVAVQTEERID